GRGLQEDRHGPGKGRCQLIAETEAPYPAWLRPEYGIVGHLAECCLEVHPVRQVELGRNTPLGPGDVFGEPLASQAGDGSEGKAETEHTAGIGERAVRPGDVPDLGCRAPHSSVAGRQQRGRGQRAARGEMITAAEVVDRARSELERGGPVVDPPEGVDLEQRAPARTPIMAAV